MEQAAPATPSGFVAAIRNRLIARGLRPAEAQRRDRIVTFATQLRTTYGGDLDVVVAAALLGDDLARGEVTATDREILDECGVPKPVAERVLATLRECADPAAEHESHEARIVSDARILARLGGRGILYLAYSTAAAGGPESDVPRDARLDVTERIQALHFEQSRQFAVRAVAFERLYLAQLNQRATMPPPLPPYVVFEGLSGSGKGTQADLLARHYQREGGSPVTLREPSPWFWHTRDHLGIGPKDFNAQTLLYLMDRELHFAPTIRQARDAGRPVVADRSYLSTLVYQSGEGWLTPENIVYLHAWLPQPTAVFVLDLPAERALERIRARPSDAVTSAQTEDETHEQLVLHRERFRALPAYFPWAHVLDATLDPEELHSIVWTRLQGKV